MKGELIMNNKMENHELAENYIRENHEKIFLNENEYKLQKIKPIYDKRWENDNEVYPYEIVTFLLDAYYLFPKRPDLSAFFVWQAINNSYNMLQMSSGKKNQISDSEGIKQLGEEIKENYDKYESYLENYIQILPEKVFKYVASYLLRGYVIENSSSILLEEKEKQKYLPAGYKSVTKKVKVLVDILNDSFGKKHLLLVSPIVETQKINLNINDGVKNRGLRHAFAKKIEKLFKSGEVEIEMFNGGNKTYRFTKEDKIAFLLFGILYASRCNNFHGNVASRMSIEHSKYKKKKKEVKATYDMYTAIFFIEYMILAISLNMQGIISDEVLEAVGKNYTLMPETK